MKPMKFRLEDIKVLRSEVRDHPIVFSDEFDSKNIILDFELKFHYEDNYVQNFSHFQYDLKQKEKNIMLCHFDLVYTFGVPDLQKVLKNFNEKKLLHLNMIAMSYSTSRGIIFSETKGFVINDFYLSPVSPNKLYDSIFGKTANSIEQD